MFERSTSDARQEPATHRCIAGRGCRAKITENDELQPAYTEHPKTLCDGCHAHYRQNIHRLLRDYAMLRVTLGERHTKPGAAVATTPTPGIVIDTNSDRLMTEITEWAGYAADIAAERLNIPRPDGSRKLAQIRLDNSLTPPEPGSIADTTWEATRPPEAERVNAFITLIEQHIDLIATAPRQDVQIWSQPRRCTQHAGEIASAKRILEYARTIKDPDEIADAADQLQQAYALAGHCNECCGWSDDGRRQASQDIEMSGIDVLDRLARLHHLTREHLGQTKLRHNYAMPCPRCGSDVGRDAGSNVVTCENDQCIKVNGKYSRSSWTEREYHFLAGMMGDDVTAKYLLAEAYWRLDGLREAVTLIRKNKDLADDPNAAQTILEFIDAAIARHPTPDERKIASDRGAAKRRQEAEDNWLWKREHPYQKPKPKPKPPPREDIPTIPASSLSTVVELDELPTGSRTAVCRDCNQIHAGECP